ncbi:porin family protein [Niabella beijingensis]|uniref:porin family protein n=1 Tax=Niabella beijingensis TaxID=2872700 RepID=UPI001CBF6412|nr:porin family protein [Niabella beijingensis]MBZ4188829.1 PorT family protein [Niabella beijingensis]
MKNLTLGFLALLSTAAMNAQTGLGVQAGVNFSNITGKDVSGAKLKTGFQVGINYDIKMSDEFSFQPGLNYLQNGLKTTGTFDNNSGSELKLNLPFLQLPLLFKYNPEVSGGNKVILAAGPYISYGIGKVKASSGNMSEKADWSDVDGEGFQRTDAGAKLLIGYELRNGLSLNLNGDLGLTKAVKDVKAHYSAFGITLGYRFR